MARIDRLKRAVGTAFRRDKPSQAAEVLVARSLIKGRVLDYGCGFGFDADSYGWEAYDPYYRPTEPKGTYDTILCTMVLNVLSRNNRAKVLARICALLAPGGAAYLTVARDLPVTGKMGTKHSLHNYVVLTLPSVFVDEKIEIYRLQQDSQFDDKTKDYVSRRDRRRDR